ncbi:unnamed protein product [Leptidea sinapis]|uniref:Uncharacterized protein n=1 Tax=Leptidea sinapis TaxID=189913 RepID=A0A5E4QP93_9NEOP|nr:unnamed protein product [Leptidea sinapis]
MVVSNKKALYIGVLSLVWSTIYMSVLIYFLILEKIDLNLRIFQYFTDNNNIKIITLVTIILLVLSALGTLTSILLLIGIIKKRHELLLPYFALGSFAVLLKLLIIILCLISKHY